MKSLQGFIFLCLLILLSGCSGKAEGSTAAKSEAPVVKSEETAVKSDPTVPKNEAPFVKSSEVPPTFTLNTLQHLLESQPKQQPGIIPNTLKIPSIGLNVPVEPVGVTQNGQMGVPESFDSVGLLVPWTKPGEPGNAVIAGHVDHKTGPAVFYHLRKMKPGDRFYVSAGTGESYTFAVKSVEKFKTPEAPLARIFGAADTPRLNLITCTGKFNRKTHEHSHRLVVFGEMVNE